MRIATILGTRPEIIRLSLLIPKLDRLADRHVLMHTGQNYVPGLSGNFFAELGLRAPDLHLQARKTSVGGQLSVMFAAAEHWLSREKPDKVLVLGDTNSALCAFIAERMGIPVVHMEAGNRCFDLEVPEEKNRRVIDTVSTFNLPYTENSKQNLLREGFPPHRIFRCGNPIYEVLRHYDDRIQDSPVLARLNLVPRKYMLATVHRAENVDRPEALASILKGFRLVAEEQGLRMICSLHPRTRSRLPAAVLRELHPLVEFHEPFGFFDFASLERNALCVLTDSGTVQEECCIFGVPAVTVRRTTERPETVECGSNIVSGLSPERIRGAVRVMTSQPARWACPEGYLDDGVAGKVAKFMFGGTADV
ncbi:UDP-N-acetylglucosamine 2-epimerase (non-hydrolyzing) [Cohnella sp. CFH 77786]|uniref:non-hydrolyzing UDP-N-acetylglucosamine 2-epimerase n=1 Tax=Cohnella sp. CFH 77786 TaxID=2662265 RepID=UPI001C60AC25|nr:UDP-N-acetylglucosamine 2-epimerase (non-hydrolyzing) [Cohnella sp. CFH 77786]MBW5447392.1 UDP-N-acetylglucosamine 2-epimerase (non-hydrolyzing) [Cohnella sp. CFH 77786]